MMRWVVARVLSPHLGSRGQSTLAVLRAWNQASVVKSGRVPVAALRTEWARLVAASPVTATDTRLVVLYAFALAKRAAVADVDALAAAHVDRVPADQWADLANAQLLAVLRAEHSRVTVSVLHRVNALREQAESLAQRQRHVVRFPNAVSYAMLLTACARDARDGPTLAHRLLYDATECDGLEPDAVMSAAYLRVVGPGGDASSFSSSSVRTGALAAQSRATIRDAIHRLTSEGRHVSAAMINALLSQHAQVYAANAHQRVGGAGSGSGPGPGGAAALWQLVQAIPEYDNVTDATRIPFDTLTLRILCHACYQNGATSVAPLLLLVSLLPLPLPLSPHRLCSSLCLSHGTRQMTSRR